MMLDSGFPVVPELFEAFADRIARCMAEQLPGTDLHGAMAPSHREAIDITAARRRPHNEGAVLVLLFRSEGRVQTVFTVRRADLRHHGGQISFPGGKREAGESLEATAVREAEEEIGLDSKSIRLMGPLTPLFIPPSRFIVYPFVAVTDQAPEFRLQEREVERILEIPLSQLWDPSTRRLESWEIDGEASEVPLFQVGEERIWGATAMITSELLAVVGKT
jgi:8-oxo-dGTP pyrophosphatase MutT (NUDIX family)